MKKTKGTGRGQQEGRVQRFCEVNKKGTEVREVRDH